MNVTMTWFKMWIKNFTYRCTFLIFPDNSHHNTWITIPDALAQHSPKLCLMSYLCCQASDVSVDVICPSPDPTTLPLRTSLFVWALMSVAEKGHKHKTNDIVTIRIAEMGVGEAFRIATHLDELSQCILSTPVGCVNLAPAFCQPRRIAENGSSKVPSK